MAGRRSSVSRSYQGIMRQIEQLPGVDRASLGSSEPWRDARDSFGAQFSVEGYARVDGEDDPRARWRTASPESFATLDAPIIAGRDFTDDDERNNENLVIVSQSLAQRMFPSVEAALNRGLMWTEPNFLSSAASVGNRARF